MRDRVLDSDIVWVAPDDQIEGSADDLAESGVAVVEVPEPVDSASEPSEPEVDDPPRDASGGDSGLFGGFGVDGNDFGDSTFGGGYSESMDPPHHWSIPWSDLMMVMFILFAVMIATEVEQPSQDPPAAEADEPIAQRDRIVRPFGDPMMTINVLERAQRVVKESDADDVDIVLMEDQSVKVSVRGPMVFELGSIDLRPEMTAFLDDLAAVIRMTPYRIEVIGHTDDQPVATALFPSNWELSTARASRVARYLIESGRMAPQRFTVVGRAEYDPMAENVSEAARAINRRVEILITRDVLPSSQVAIQ